MRSPLPELVLEPISHTDLKLMAALMEEEERAWLAELDWDHSPIRKILLSFAEQRMLPGYVLRDGRRATGYCYFLVYRHKGVIGTLYASKPDPQDQAEQILAASILSLKESKKIRRIEAQIIPLNGLDLTAIFCRHGFSHFVRQYMELDLEQFERNAVAESPYPIVRWNTTHLPQAAEVAFRSYRRGIDAVICEDYCSRESCESYLHSLVDNPGCGLFLPQSSFVALDRRGHPCGFVLTSRLSRQAAMIPQISIHPSHMARGLGKALIGRAFGELRSEGFRSVRLTVTHQNTRAYQWYLRLGFRERREFGAYLWQRS